MREEADKYDSRNPENEGMGEDLKGFDLVEDNLEGYFVTVREHGTLLAIKHPETHSIEILIESHLVESKWYSIEGCKDGRVEMIFSKLSPISSCKNITPEVVQAWFTTLLFKLEN